MLHQILTHPLSHVQQSILATQTPKFVILDLHVIVEAKAFSQLKVHQTLTQGDAVIN